MAGYLIKINKQNTMANEKMDRDSKKNINEDVPITPDPETLHKTDPQENMEGPVSSLMHNTGKGFETNKTREEAQKEKDENM